jgi:hypothetical protein
MKITRRRMFTALAAVATAGLGGLGIRSGAARYYDGPVSDHFDGLRFFDPHGSPPNSRHGLRAPSGVSRSSGTRRFCCKRRA